MPAAVAAHIDSAKHALDAFPVSHPEMLVGRASLGAPAAGMLRRRRSRLRESISRLSWGVSGVSEVAGAVLRGEVVEDFADAVPQGWDGVLGGFAQQRLEL